MKKITLFILVLCTFTGQLHAQEGYTYTLDHNGSLSFTVSAVPNTSASNFATSVQSYGFTITVPDGVTASITSSYGNGAGATFFDGSAVGEPNIDGYLITETLGSPLGLPAPSAGTVSPMLTIQLDGSPTTGEISLLANDSPLATAVTSLKCFMSADMTDDATANFPPVVDTAGSGLSGTTSFMLNTLSTKDANLLSSISVSPNPTKGILYLSGNVTKLKGVNIYSMTGQHVMEIKDSLGEINIESLQSAIYFVKLNTADGSRMLKIIKE